VVLQAGREGPDRMQALEDFARAYWYPVYAFIRRQGADADDAQDLTQEFFEKMIEKDWLAGVERRETRFSTLLLTILRRFLVSHHRYETQDKRGGGRPTVSLDMAQAEAWYGVEPRTHETPESIFEHRFALSVMAAAIAALKAHLHASGRGRLADILSPFLSREPSRGEYDAASAALGLSSNAVAATVRRLRLEARDFVRAEVAAGLTDEAAIKEEMSHISAALRQVS
jgi:DNA-directed RNA polymerase specialized sigma24 family protein